NEDAITGGPSDGGGNEVYISYGNKPADLTSSDDTESDYTEVATYGFDVFKYESLTDAPNKTPLAGAVFSLYSDPSLTEPIEFIEESGYYRPVIGTETVAALISPAGGVISLKGLAAGTYYLVEVTPPAGFALLDAPLTVVIISDTEVKAGADETEANSSLPLTDNTVEVENGTGNLFPDTGGIGTYILYGVGGALMVGAFALVLLRRKKR
ncbi:MAG: LPXTG cell wall anchor domain-containing protein, partial [Oscillospiraceae bacterium]|nr:LPXTG cell wall anchor domain-containing protein [Oscillospiraceae bacterium]